MILKSIFTGMLCLSMAQAAPPPVMATMTPPAVELPEPNPNFYAEANKKWKKAGRKVANNLQSSKEFEENLMKPWMAVGKDSEALSNLLVTSHAKYDSYTPDVQYFLTQLHIMIPLKGIVWRLRPLFETETLVALKLKKGHKGNKATHISAVQFVRNAVTGLSAAFPTDQTEAVIGYLTKPGIEMTEESQFKNMVEFQDFLVDVYVKYLNESALRIMALEKNHSASEPWVWNNKMFYPSAATFRDGFNQFVGHGSAERHVAAAVMFEAIHDAYVFSAYNQEELIQVAGQLGQSFGIDAVKSRDADEMGLTDKERVTIIKNISKDTGLLSLRGVKGNKKSNDDKRPDGYGADQMKKAWTAKWWAIHEYSEAYDKVDGKPANPTMAINPVLYQNNVQNRLNAGVKKMKKAIQGIEEFRDPVTAEVVQLNVKNFYDDPPETLVSLMANNWDAGRPTTVKNSQGKDLEYRDYFKDRSNSWDNKAWEPYVISAKGKKDPNYMMKVKRVMHYSKGATPVFGLVDTLVR